ncbi:rho guanine nucleotide exchange factor 10-like isoform X2 [Ornithodoros turicata]|uniref:rho guanine nucleotide exchange factor 10-like isoform X2 n=1 Tax=Ornithodoros turicata TaxID=34597 RepID=UPI0031395A6E
MASKAPYYYSELGPDKAGVAGPMPQNNTLGGHSAEESSSLGFNGTPPPVEPPPSDASASPVTDHGGFFNPLLSIEPDISAPDTPRRNAQSHKKKKKAKKKGGSPSKSNGIYGTTTAYAKQLLFGAKDSKKPAGSPEKKQGVRRRGSEPNIYEEITDAEEYARNECLRVGGAPTIPRRPRPQPEHVREEVTRVHRTHVHILENLNLDVETMLMPDTCTAKLEHTSGKEGDYGTVGAAKSHIPASTWRRVMNEYVEHQVPPVEVSSGTLPASAYRSKGLWIPYPSHKTFQPPATASPYGRTSQHYASTAAGEPLYMLYDDTHKRHVTPLLAGGDMCRPEDNIYEEVDIYRRENGCEDGYSVTGSEPGLDHSESSEEGDVASRTSSLGLAARLVENAKPLKKRKDSDLTSSFTRFFSTRRKDYDSDKLSRMGSRQLSEDEGYVDIKVPKKQRPPLTLPAMPPGLTSEQMKRRLIVNNIVESENSYVGSLQRLISDFKRPLLQSQPPLLSQRKIDIMFFRLEEILQCHTLFGIALTQCVWEWDDRERIGEVFLASFSKSVVLDIYSEFINNFSTAMETAKQAAKSKSAFADFLKMKQIYSPDRLSFFGLMVKPVQRFPQFILLLQDLLKHTPKGHPDRMSLQLALTQLESLAEALNERKREAEQHHAVLQVLGSLGSKFSLKSLDGGSDHFLLRQDDVLQLEVDQSGLVVKSKSRRIFLLNDLLVCVTATPRSSSEGSSGQNRERLTLKWAVPLQEVDVQDDIAPATRNLLASSGRARNSGSRLVPVGGAGNSECSGSMQVLYDELTNLVHDMEVMSRVAVLVSSLKRSYPEITMEAIQMVSRGIQDAIRQKDEEITLLDSCCLQLAVPHKSKSQKVQISFQMSTPAVKRDWTTDLRLAKLALDPDNMPAWDVLEQDKRPQSKLPLLVRLMPLFPATTPTEVKCGCFYNTVPQPGGLRIQYLWLCSTDGVNSHLVILCLHDVVLRPISAFDLPESRIAAMEAVPPPLPPEGTAQHPGSAETVWITTESKRLILLRASCPDKWTEVGSTTVGYTVTQILYHCERVYVALVNGTLSIYRRDTAGNWDLDSPSILVLGTDPITSLLPLGTSLYCACADKIYVLDGFTSDIQKTHLLGQEDGSHALLLAHSGTGLWIALKNSARICLYHTETFRHLQDVNVADSVSRFLSAKQGSVRPAVTVTALVAGRGLLWVGTSAGVVLTLPLPRLEGVPILSGRPHLAYHAHQGPVTFLLCLQPRVYPLRPHDATHSRSTLGSAPEDVVEEEEEEPGVEPAVGPAEEEAPPSSVSKQKSDSMLPSTPVGRKNARGLRRTVGENVHMSGAKTLPRGLSICPGGVRPVGHRAPPGTALALQDDTESSPDASVSEVYGLYADLMNVQDYESHERLNHSDPELVNFHFATLGRKTQQRSGRPRSWDLSTMEVSGDSDSSAAAPDTNSNPQNPQLAQTTSSSDAANTKSSYASSPSPSISSVEGSGGYGTLRPPRRSGPARGGPGPRGGLDGAPQNKTLLTLTGGCGYVNWRKAERDAASPPSGDALVLVWEMKV